MKLPPGPIEKASTFQKELLNAKNESEVIDILCRRGSSMGWFSDMPDGLFEKLQAMRTKTIHQQLVREELGDPNICQVCED